MNELLKGLVKESTKGTTENGMSCVNTTNSSVLDFYSTMGALRNRTEKEIINKFVRS